MALRHVIDAATDSNDMFSLTLASQVHKQCSCQVASDGISALSQIVQRQSQKMRRHSAWIGAAAMSTTPASSKPEILPRIHTLVLGCRENER